MLKSWYLIGDEPNIDRTKYYCKGILIGVGKTIGLLYCMLGGGIPKDFLDDLQKAWRLDHIQLDSFDRRNRFQTEAASGLPTSTNIFSLG